MDLRVIDNGCRMEATELLTIGGEELYISLRLYGQHNNIDQTGT